MHAIGADVSERLDVVPAQFLVLVTHRPKYACRACEETVVQAPAPERLIKGGLPTEAMVASVLVSKYVWHLRQAQMLAAQGLDIKRSVLAFWVGYAAAELRPVYDRLRDLILTSGKVAVDETKAPVLDPGRGRVKEGYFWAVARDDRSWGGKDPPAVAFAYAPGRGAIHGLKLLDDYRGVVQCDGYAAYKTIAAKTPDGRITLAFCWSHLRRRFFDHAKGEAPIAREALEKSPRSTRSRRRSGAQAPTSVAACARRRANRLSWRSGPGSSISWRASRASRESPRSSAMV